MPGRRPARALAILLVAATTEGCAPTAPPSASGGPAATAMPAPRAATGESAHGYAPPKPTGCIAAVRAGFSFTCVLKTNGTVWCTGENAFGHLGDGTRERRLRPVQVSGLTGVKRLASGGYQSCAISGDGGVWCWGSVLGQRDSALKPIRVPALPPMVDVASEYETDCALESSGTLWCWKQSRPTSGEPKPPERVGLASVAESAPGFFHTCARKTDSTVWCWGRTVDGQAGKQYTGELEAAAPVQVHLPRRAQKLVSGSHHACALLDNAEAWCWGAFECHRGMLPGDRGPSRYLADVIDIDAGGEHTCAVLANGTVRCSGCNVYGEVGDGTLENFRSSPTPVRDLASVVEISAGHNHTCARTQDGKVVCWGTGGGGELGDGTTENFRTAPKTAMDLPCP